MLQLALSVPSTFRQQHSRARTSSPHRHTKSDGMYTKTADSNCFSKIRKTEQLVAAAAGHHGLPGTPLRRAHVLHDTTAVSMPKRWAVQGCFGDGAGGTEVAKDVVDKCPQPFC